MASVRYAFGMDPEDLTFDDTPEPALQSFFPGATFTGLSGWFTQSDGTNIFLVDGKEVRRE